MQSRRWMCPWRNRRNWADRKERPRRLNTPGPSSECWLAPSVSQQGSSSTMPYAPLWLRGNNSQEWKKPRGQVYPRSFMVRSERLGGSPDRRQNISERPWFPITLAMAGLLWQRGNASGGWHPKWPSLSPWRAVASCFQLDASPRPQASGDTTLHRASAHRASANS